MLARGDEVVVADDLSTGDRANLDKRAELRIADVSNATALAEALPGERADADVHLAAKTKRGEPITVYGDGRYDRDYVYVADVVEAVLAALGGKHHGVYNIGTGVATSVNELVSALTAVLGPSAGVRSALPRAGEVLRACVDPSKAGRDRLWRSRTALAEGLRLTALAEGALAAPA